MLHPETGKRRPGLQAPTPSEPGPTTPCPVPAMRRLHETQDFDREFLEAVGRNPEGAPWYFDRFALGMEHDISPPGQWAAVRKQAVVEGDVDLL